MPGRGCNEPAAGAQLRSLGDGTTRTGCHLLARIGANRSRLPLTGTFFRIGAVNGSRLGRGWPLGVGYGILLSAASMLATPVNAFGFAASAFAFLYAWTFSLPFLLAVVAARDPTGRLSPLINLMIGAGLGLGPTLYAATLKTTPNFRLAVPY